ncbi:MAG: hypothetical protein ICV74_08215 [Thermoleophilia bacterium]|nr:hypothetical protein [Thermoleophilia bacterium]
MRPALVIAAAVAAALVALAVLATVVLRDDDGGMRTIVVTTAVQETAQTGEEAAPPPPPPAKPKPLRRPRNGVLFRGNGDRTLPPLRVRGEGTTLQWVNDGAVFSLFSEDGVVVDSVARRGSTFLRAGRHRLSVVAAGKWTIAIRRASAGR